MPLFRRSILVMGWFGGLATVALADSITYTFTPIGDPLATSGTAAMGINDSGQIVGTYAAPAGQQSASPTSPLANSARTTAWCSKRGAEFRNRACFPLRTGAISPGIFVQLASGFLDTGGVFTTINPFPSAVFSTSTAINNTGGIIGDYFDGVQSLGFVDTAGIFSGLNPPNTNPNCPGCEYLETILTGINDAGMIVGSGQGFGGFLYNAGTFTALNITPTGINNAGQIVL